MKLKHLITLTAMTVALSVPAFAQDDATPPPSPQKKEGDHGKKIMEMLKLNEDQAQKLKSLMEEVHKSRESMRSEFDALKEKEQQLRKEFNALRDKADKKSQEIMAKAKTFLTPEQYSKLESMHAKRKEMMKRHGKEKGSSQEGQGDSSSQRRNRPERPNDRSNQGGGSANSDPLGGL